MKPDNTKLNFSLKISAIVVLILLAIYLFADYVMPVLGKFLSVIFPLILPFLLAVFITVLVNPIVNWLQRRIKIRRSYVVAIVLTITLFALVGIIAVLVVHLIKEIYILAADFSDSSYGIDVNAVLSYIENFYTNSPLVNYVEPSVIKNGFSNFANTFTGWMTDFLYKMADILKATPAILFMLLVACFATYYFCKDENMVINFIAKISPKKMEDAAKKTYMDMVSVFFGYVRAQLILITVTAVISVIGFMILRTDYVLVMGLLVGFCDVLPILGPGTVFIPWAIICAVNGDYSTAIGLLIVYLVAVVVRHLIQPKLIADGIGLHPLATIAAIYIGLKLFGVWGLIFGPIILVIILGIFESYKQSKKQKKVGLGNSGNSGGSDSGAQNSA